MMPRHYRLLLVALAPIILLFAQSSAAQSAYTFRKLVQSGNVSPSPHLLGEILESSLDDRGGIVYGADGGLFYSPKPGRVSTFGVFRSPAPGGGRFLQSWSSAVNSSGKIFFRGEVTAPSVSGIYSKSGNKFSLLVPDGPVSSNGTSFSPEFPVPNAAGDFAFVDGGRSLYLYSKGSITPIALQGQPAPGGGTFNVFSGYAINLSDQVAFISYLAPSGMGVYLASGGTITKIIATGDVFPDGTTFAFPEGVSMNDSGQIAFGGVNNNGSAQYEGLFLYSGGHYSVILPTLTTLPDGSYLFYVIQSSMNNAGQMVLGCITSNGLGTYIFSAGRLTQVAVSGQTAPDGDVFGKSGEYGAEINNSGQVLLLSGMVHHFATLYLFSGGQLTRIAGQDDPVQHVPKFEYPGPINIAADDQVLISDSTFPGGSGRFRVSPGIINQNTSFLANTTTTTPTGGITLIPSSAMNSNGEVAIEAFTSENYANILLDSGSGPNLVVGGPNAAFSPSGAMSINNSGDVGFFAYGPSGASFCLYSKGQTSFLTAIPGYPFTVSMNNSDSLASLVMATAPDQNGIYSYSNGAVTPLAVTGAPAPGGGNFSFVNPDTRFGPVMNDSGATAFGAALDTANQTEIFVSANGTLSRIAGAGDIAPDGSTFAWVDSPSINASGDIAFWAITSSELGIFVYSNGVITKVVATGDMIGRHTIGYVDYPHLGDTGHIAFFAMLSDGSSAVFLARPRPTRQDEVAMSKDDLLLSSSTPLKADSPLVSQLRHQYKRLIDAQQQRGRKFVSPDARQGPGRPVAN